MKLNRAKLTIGSAFMALSMGVAQAGPQDITPGVDLPKEMTKHLEMVGSVFEAGYAPRAWKQQFAQWDLATTINNLKAKITPQTTVKDYQAILTEFIRSTRDYHVSVSLFSTEAATLPLTVRGTSGKYFLGFIDRTKLTEDAFPFSEGDEVIEFGGKPIQEAINGVLAEGEHNVTETDQSLAELNLTRRRAARGYSVPRGPIELGIKKQKTEVVKRIQLIWDYAPEKIDRIDGSGKKFSTSSLDQIKALKGFSFLNRPFVAPFALDEEEATAEPVANKFAIGEKTSYLPELGNVIWRNPADKFFNAYIYQTEDKRLIGVVRIATYSPSVPAVAAVAEFASIIKQFKNTEALVIDQLSNPGGSVFYLYALASMLSDQPLFAPKHRMTLMASDVAEAVAAIPGLEKITNDEEAKKAIGAAELSGYPVNYTVAKYILEFSRFVVSQWSQGKRLTDPFYLWGAEKINPSNVATYSKPILLLTNELDFSGGDFFPTIMQDNKRAKIMGTRTAGAGGYVLEVKVPNLFGVDGFRYTGSIAERLDLNPIENLGVTPEVALGITVEDFTDEFKPFKNKVNEEVNKFFK